MVFFKATGPGHIQARTAEVLGWGLGISSCVQAGASDSDPVGMDLEARTAEVLGPGLGMSSCIQAYAPSSPLALTSESAAQKLGSVT